MMKMKTKFIVFGIIAVLILSSLSSGFYLGELFRLIFGISPSEFTTTEFRKIRDDPSFETTMDFLGRDADSLIVKFHHDSSVEKLIRVEGDVDYSISTEI